MGLPGWSAGFSPVRGGIFVATRRARFTAPSGRYRPDDAAPTGLGNLLRTPFYNGAAPTALGPGTNRGG